MEEKHDLSNYNIIHVKKENQEYIQFKKLLKYSDIISHCYSVGTDKNYRTLNIDLSNLTDDEYKKNLENYKTLCIENNMDYTKILRARQAHTDIVIAKDNIEKNKTLDTTELADGLITDKRNLVLATTNADCILLLFFDPVKKVIANTHSGWKGTLQEISVKTIEKMKNEYGCNPKDIIVCICPSIRKCHFEVEEDVYSLYFDQFKKLGDINVFIEKKGNKWHIDTVLINKIILKKAGILEENIIDCGICSVCNKNYIHSYRAEGKGYGLGVALICLK